MQLKAETYQKIGICVVTMLTVCLMSYGSVLFSISNGLSPSVRTFAVWPVNALLLSLVLLSAPPLRSGLLLAGFLGMWGGKLLAGYGSVTPVLLSFFNTVEVLVAATLIERKSLCNARASLQQMFGRLVFWVAFLIPALAAALAVCLISLFERVPFPETWALRFMSDGLGMLIIMIPLMLISRLEEFTELKRRDKLLEMLAFVVVVAAMDVFAFTAARLPLLFTVYPVMMLATFRLHVVGAALVVFLTSTLAIYYMQILNLGPIAAASVARPEERVLLLQGFLAAIALTKIPLSVILRHRGELRRDLACRVAQLAEAYEREKLVARTFQQAALDEHLPLIPGLVLDAVYQPAKAESLVGGDWYDAFRLPDGRIVLSIGDVAGNGLHAAVLMGSVRQSIRTAALINPDPMAILNAVDRIVRAMNREFVTAFVAVIDPLFFELVYSCAGHPPPLLRMPDGSVRKLTQCDLPLGLRQHDTEASVAIGIEPGSLLAFYTDGLTEFERDPILGEERLLAAMSAISEPSRAAGDLYRGVLNGYIQHDDAAILMASFERPLSSMDGEAPIAKWEFNVNDVAVAHEKRHSFLDVLATIGFTVGERAAAELVFGELLGNIVRYVGGKVTMYLDMSGEAAVLHVLDQGYGFEYNPRLPKDLMSERGRGLFLVSTFAEEVSISRRKGQGSHARVVLCGRIRAQGVSRRTVRPIRAMTVGKVAPSPCEALHRP